MPQTKLKKNPAQDKAPKAPPITRELTPLQEQLCDIAAHLLMNGGHEDDVYSVVYGLAAHAYRHKFPEYPKDALERDKNADRWASGQAPIFIRQLIRHWPDVMPEPEAVQPSTVAEMARQSARSRMMNAVQEFDQSSMLEGSIGDVYLLAHILEIVVSGGTCLADAFAFEIDADFTWVKTARHHVKAVEQFIVLITGEKEEAA